ncbi:MAG: hypothetical protein QNJ55_00475 [Xenococcus sp. MO_188.B8]|nr:hypothetical protein [Xenococcus sp. MO_188.B8]
MSSKFELRYQEVSWQSNSFSIREEIGVLTRRMFWALVDLGMKPFGMSDKRHCP